MPSDEVVALREELEDTQRQLDHWRERAVSEWAAKAAVPRRPSLLSQLSKLITKVLNGPQLERLRTSPTLRRWVERTGLMKAAKRVYSAVDPRQAGNSIQPTDL